MIEYLSRIIDVIFLGQYANTCEDDIYIIYTWYKSFANKCM